MGYVRLFIELRKEDSGEAAGQARIEMQDRPGRVDVKVRGVLMGLAEGEPYQAVLVCENAGSYREYPVGQCSANSRGQASLMYRGSVQAEPGDPLGIGSFKAILARSGGKRVVGYRFEPVLIPDRYEEPARAEHLPEEEDSVVMETAAAVVAVEEPIAAEEPALEERAAEPPVEEDGFVSAESVLEEPVSIEEPEVVKAEAAVSREVSPMQETGADPLPVYVLQDLNQVEEICGEAGRRAFDRYHHLILVRQGEKSQLGMPCRYRSSQQEELQADGYTEFMTPHGGAPSYGEFGYWMKRLE